MTDLEGVRLNRGAGDGCVKPSTSVYTARCSFAPCLGASTIVRTGAKQASLPMIVSHSSRVLVLSIALSFAFNSGHCVVSCCC